MRPPIYARAAGQRINGYILTERQTHGATSVTHQAGALKPKFLARMSAERRRPRASQPLWIRKQLPEPEFVHVTSSLGSARLHHLLACSALAWTRTAMFPGWCWFLHILQCARGISAQAKTSDRQGSMRRSTTSRFASHA